MSKYKEDYDDSDGVWRTIGGRRVFIKKGQRLSEAMKESGKFSKKGQDENSKNRDMEIEAGINSKESNNLKGISREEYNKYVEDKLELRVKAEEEISKVKSPEEKQEIWDRYWKEYYKSKR